MFHYDSYDLLPFFPFGYALVGNVRGDGETSELVCTCTRGDFWGMVWVGIEYVVRGPWEKDRCLFFMGGFFFLVCGFCIFFSPPPLCLSSSSSSLHFANRQRKKKSKGDLLIASWY